MNYPLLIADENKSVINARRLGSQKISRKRLRWYPEQLFLLTKKGGWKVISKVKPKITLHKYWRKFGVYLFSFQNILFFIIISAIPQVADFSNHCFLFLFWLVFFLKKLRDIHFRSLICRLLYCCT